MSEEDKKEMTEEQRLELAAKLDAELDEYINSLEEKKYTEGWPEDRWEEEMEKHPFFMKTTPEPGQELSPLMEGLQQLKYSDQENTPEELANNYKEDGNFNYKYKKYRLAILSYTEGLRSKCQDKELLAQLYNNRAAAQFMIKNYRSSLSDCKQALKLKADYPKALTRAATCCLEIKDYDQCMELCDRLLKQSPTEKAIIDLRAEAAKRQKEARRDSRRQEFEENKKRMREEKLLNIIRNRNIKVEVAEGRTAELQLSDLEAKLPQVAQHTVHLDEDEKLIWPVLILYPESQQTDFIQECHESSPFAEYLEVLFGEQPQWDTSGRYKPDTVNVYFESHIDSKPYRIDAGQSLSEILKHDMMVVRGGTPAFMILVRGSEAERRFLSNY